MKKIIGSLFAVMAMHFITSAPAFAAEAAESAAAGGLAEGIKYLSAAVAVGLCAIATGIAQSRIGAAGMGSIVEKPETIGTVMICLAIPETMVILGFVVAAMIIIL